MKEPVEMTRDLRVDLKELLSLIKFDDVAARAKLPDGGAHSSSFVLAGIEGTADERRVREADLRVQKGWSEVPHGHSNMCAGFIVPKGKWHGRHYDRPEAPAGHNTLPPSARYSAGSPVAGQIVTDTSRALLPPGPPFLPVIMNAHSMRWMTALKASARWRMARSPDSFRIANPASLMASCKS